MTDADDVIARAREVRAAAMPGPWRVAHHGGWEIEAAPNVLIADLGPISTAPDDARAIVLAVNALGPLLDVLEAAQAWRIARQGRMGEPVAAHDAAQAIDRALAALRAEVQR
jgi:hypothetical protein